MASESYDNLQIQVLNCFIQDIQRTHELSLHLQYLIESCQTTLNITSSLQEAIFKVNDLLCSLEEIDEGLKILDAIKNKGLYRVLYHYPILDGMEPR